MPISAVFLRSFDAGGAVEFPDSLIHPSDELLDLLVPILKCPGGEGRYASISPTTTLIRGRHTQTRLFPRMCFIISYAPRLTTLSKPAQIGEHLSLPLRPTLQAHIGATLIHGWIHLARRLVDVIGDTNWGAWNKNRKPVKGAPPSTSGQAPAQNRAQDTGGGDGQPADVSPICGPVAIP